MSDKKVKIFIGGKEFEVFPMSYTDNHINCRCIASTPPRLDMIIRYAAKKRDLNIALEIEDYEKAAVLRDEMLAIKEQL